MLTRLGLAALGLFSLFVSLCDLALVGVFADFPADFLSGLPWTAAFSFIVLIQSSGRSGFLNSRRGEKVMEPLPREVRGLSNTDSGRLSDI